MDKKNLPNIASVIAILFSLAALFISITQKSSLGSKELQVELERMKQVIVQNVQTNEDLYNQAIDRDKFTEELENSQQRQFDLQEVSENNNQQIELLKAEILKNQTLTEGIVEQLGYTIVFGEELQDETKTTFDQVDYSLNFLKERQELIIETLKLMNDLE